MLNRCWCTHIVAVVKIQTIFHKNCFCIQRQWARCAARIVIFTLQNPYSQIIQLIKNLGNFTELSHEVSVPKFCKEKKKHIYSIKKNIFFLQTNPIFLSSNCVHVCKTTQLMHTIYAERQRKFMNNNAIFITLRSPNDRFDKLIPLRFHPFLSTAWMG